MTIMVGIDMHAKQLVCEIGYGRIVPQKCTFANTLTGHLELIAAITTLKSSMRAHNALVAYEASGLGYLLYDRLCEAGFQCEVLAPTELLRSATGFKKKTDKKDASYIYETLRGHVLAGNRLNSIWVAGKQLRDDRELVRARFDLGQKITMVKVQIQTLLKKFGISKPEDTEAWRVSFRKWLYSLPETSGPGFKHCLETLLCQLSFFESEENRLRKEILKLSREDRYRAQCERLLKIPGVGLVTAMTFLTEIGDMRRFSNRRQLGAYLGLAPSSFESGEMSDRKGRITRNGPYRVRGVLNQALWVHLKHDGVEKLTYDRLVARNPRHKKKAVVACMRRLAVCMWHEATDVLKSNQAGLAA